MMLSSASLLLLNKPFECGFMAHICVIVGSSSMVVTLETFSNSEAIIAVYANPVHISKTEQSLPLYGFKDAILRRVSSFGSTPNPNRCILNPAISAVGGKSGLVSSEGHKAHTLSMVFEYIRHGSKTGSDGFSLSIVQGRTTLYTVKSSGSMSNTSSRRNAIALSSSPFLLISTCVLSIRMALIDTPKSTVCSNVTSSLPSFFSCHSVLHLFAKHAVKRHFVPSSSNSQTVLPRSRPPSSSSSVSTNGKEGAEEEEEKEEEEEEEDAFNPLLCRRRYRPSLRPSFLTTFVFQFSSGVGDALAAALFISPRTAREN